MTAPPLISHAAYVAATATFLALAIVVAILRIIVRVYRFRCIYVDDYFLFLAIATLIASNALFFAALSDLYLFAAVAGGRSQLPGNFLQTATGTATFAIAAEVLSWTTIFAVKFSFIFYFRALVRRLPGLTIWWRIVVAICAPVAIVSICASFIVCPYVGSAILSHCVTSPGFLQRERIVLYYSVISDILTDALIISIPLCLLGQTHLRLGQKISVGILLCLSMFMIAIAMVRGIAARVYGIHDQIWASFWVQLETSVSVIMVCTMMFKTLFVVQKPSTPEKYSPRSSDRLWWKRKKAPQLPEIETGATITGIRTVIRENGRTTLGSFGSEAWPLTDSQKHWRVSHDESRSADTGEV